MFKISITCCLIFALGLSPVYAQTKTATPEKQAEFKRRVVDWGTNKQINIKLHSGEKISGRIAEIQNDFFSLQSVTKDGKVSSQQINFSDINKLSAKGNPGKVAGMTAIGILAGVGVTCIVIVAAIIANES